MIDNKTAFSVSSLNKYIKSIFDNNFLLRGLNIKGELSNLKKYPSGHVYFTLKDEESAIKAVMFYEYAKHLDINLKDGDEVIVHGRVSVYPQRGEYQVYVDAMELSGKGSQLLELEMLKKKLAAEGLFDESKKRKINIFPHAVGVISAPNSAALADIKTNLLRRNPLIDVVLFPSLVQGNDAPKDLLRALNEAKNSKIDTLIIGRGGGASEDLSAFNDEALVRAAAEFPVPIISAVGHEVDFTLIDFVADARASTPTGAAELAAIDKREIYQILDQAENDLSNVLHNRIEYYSNKLENIKSRSFFINPKNMYSEKLSELQNTNNKLNLLMKGFLTIKKEELSSYKKHLNALSPKGVLKRGYSIMNDDKGNIVKSINELKIDQSVKTIFADGIAEAKIINKEKING